MNKEKAILVISSIALAYSLLATAFYIPYYNDSFWKGSWKENSGFSEEKVNNIYNDFRTYLDEDYFGYERLHLLSEFSHDEKEHMKDVKKIIDWICILYYTAILAIIAFLAYIYPKSKEELSKALLYGGLGSLAFLAITGITALIDFNTFWEMLHGALFQEGTWRFPPDSLLATLFLKNDFFQEFTQRFAAYGILASTGSAVIGYYLKKLTS